MRYEFRFQARDGGRTYLDVPASADLSGDADLPFAALYLNGARLPEASPLHEAVHDYLVASGLIEDMQRVSASPA